MLAWEASPSSDELEACLARVSAEKRVRLRAMRSSDAMTQSLFGELLARLLACDFLGASNTELRFALKPGGKPYLEGARDFHHNVSHTDRAVAVAVTREPVGVDLERLSRQISPRVAKRIFTQGEIDAALKNEVGQNAGFLALWTKKEALLKWSGRGFAGDFSGASTHEAEDAPPVQTFYTPELILAHCCADPAAGIETVSPEHFHRRVAALEEIG